MSSSAAAGGTRFFSASLLGHRLILSSVALEIALILLIDYTHWGNALFGTYPLAVEVWLFEIPFALAMLALEDLRKWWLRHHSGTPTKI